MQTQSLSAQQNTLSEKSESVLEVVLYKIKPEWGQDFESIKASVRKHIGEYPGFISWKSLMSAKEDRLVLDLVEWETMADAKNAAMEVEKDPQFLPFMNTTEEIRFMDHFNYQSDNNSKVAYSDKAYYEASESPSKIAISEMIALTLTGQSSPESEIFLRSIPTLYEAFGQIQSNHTEENKSFDLAPLEAYWWVESTIPFEETPRGEWFWKIVLPIPSFVTKKDLEGIRSILLNSYRINELKIETLAEEKAVQILHIGSYDDEASTIEKLMNFVEKEDLTIRGSHHEIYLDDPNTTPVNELKTIIRYSVQ